MIERTLGILKPDAVRRGLIGEILRRYEEKGLRIMALKRLCLTKSEAERFYEVHRLRPFFSSLTDFMASGPIVAFVLEGEGAIELQRELIGATDPAKASAGTIRAVFGAGIEENVVHGSDSAASAAFEIPFFFSALELDG